MRGAFRKDRETADVLKNSGIAGCELGAPAYALWAEYSWNSAHPGCHELERKNRPLFADAGILDIIAERASSGFFGKQAGPALKPLFDNMFSFYLTVDPARMAVSNQGKFNQRRAGLRRSLLMGGSGFLPSQAARHPVQCPNRLRQ